MPENVEFIRRHPWLRRWAWPFTIGLLMALLVATITLSVLILDTQEKIDANAKRLAREEARSIAEDLATKTGAVATCYASARTRPGLIVILRVIAGVANDNGDRRVIDSVIDSYEKRIPTLAECDERTRAVNLDPSDFPPSSDTRGEP